MSDYTLLPVAFLYTRSRSAIEGATRFQKLVFLAQEESDVPELYSYHADSYGPYSYDLQDDIDALLKEGYIEKNVERNAVGNERHVFSVNQEGIEAVRRLLTQPRYKGLFEKIQAMKQEYNQKPLDHLLQYVYQNYPEYATESELDLERLFDPDAQSEFLEPEEKEYVGTSPGNWKQVNPSAEEFFSTE